MQNHFIGSILIKNDKIVIQFGYLVEQLEIVRIGEKMSTQQM